MAGLDAVSTCKCARICQQAAANFVVWVVLGGLDGLESLISDGRWRSMQPTVSSGLQGWPPSTSLTWPKGAESSYLAPKARTGTGAG